MWHSEVPFIHHSLEHVKAVTFYSNVLFSFVLWYNDSFNMADGKSVKSILFLVRHIVRLQIPVTQSELLTKGVFEGESYFYLRVWTASC